MIKSDHSAHDDCDSIMMIPTDALAYAIAPQPRTHDFDQFIRICQIAEIDPYDATDDDTLDSPLALDIIRRRNMLFDFSDSYPDYAPYSYYSDSCLDDLTEMLDYDTISDFDEYALNRRFDEFCFDHRLPNDNYDI